MDSIVERGTNWTNEEKLCLLNIWAEDDIQAQLDGTTRDVKVYRRMVDQMASMGYVARSQQQVKEKIKRWKREYKSVIDNRKKTGRGRKTCEFFEKLNEILGNRPAMRPHIMLQSGLSVEEMAQQADIHVIDEMEDEGQSDDEENVHPDANLNQSVASVISTDSTDSPSLPSTSGENMLLESEGDISTPTKPVKDVQKGRKRKQSRVDAGVASMENMMAKFLKYQEDAEKRFLEMERTQQEREEKLRREDIERENVRRREERDHELRMMQLIGQMGGPQPHYMPYHQQQRETATLSVPSQHTDFSFTDTYNLTNL